MSVVSDQMMKVLPFKELHKELFHPVDETNNFGCNYYTSSEEADQTCEGLTLPDVDTLAPVEALPIASALAWELQTPSAP